MRVIHRLYFDHCSQFFSFLTCKSTRACREKEKLILFRGCEKNFHPDWNRPECNLADNPLNSALSPRQTGGDFILSLSLAAILTARLLHSIGRYVCRKDFYKAHQTGDVLLSMLLANINGKELGDEFHSSQVLNRNYLCTGSRRLLCTGSDAGRLPSGVRTNSDFHGLSCGRGLLDGIR